MERFAGFSVVQRQSHFWCSWRCRKIRASFLVSFWIQNGPPKDSILGTCQRTFFQLLFLMILGSSWTRFWGPPQHQKWAFRWGHPSKIRKTMLSKKTSFRCRFWAPNALQKGTKNKALLFLHLHEHQKWLCLWTIEKPAKEKCAFRLDESTPARVPSRRNAYFLGYIDRCLTYLAHFCPLQTCSRTCSEPQNGPFWMFIGTQTRPQVVQKEVVHFAFCILATFWKRHQRRWCLLCTNECVPEKHFHVSFLTLEGGIDIPKARWRG